MTCAHFLIFTRAFETRHTHAPRVAPCRQWPSPWCVERCKNRRETECEPHTHVPSALTGMESPSGTNSERMKTLRHSAAMA